MKQMVYVVLDNGEVVGVYDEYVNAEAVASETATITPVIVGQTDDCRVGCETPSEVITAMEYELQNLCESEVGTDHFGVPDDEDEEDIWDEEEEEEWDENEDEEESDPIEKIVYEMDGQRVISKADAAEILRMMHNVVAQDRRVPDEAKADFVGQMMLDFAKEHGIWGVDMRE